MNEFDNAQDNRPWAKIAVDYLVNPKIDALSDSAILLHLALILRSAQQRSDGKVSARAVLQRGPEALEELLTGELLRKIDEKTYQIHDYLQHQTPAKHINFRAEAGAKGAHSRWHGKTGRYDPTCHWCSPMANDSPDPI